MTSRTGRRQLILLLPGAVAALIGLVWVGQGAGWIPGSFMTGDPLWLVIGAVFLVVGVALLARGLGAGGPRAPSR